MFNPIFLTESYFTNGNMLPCDDAPDVQASPAPDLSAVTGPAPYPTDPTPNSPLSAITGEPVDQGDVPANGSTVAGGTVGAAAAPPPSLWKQVLIGALTGMSGGGNNFGQGLSNGAAAVQAKQQRDFQNQQQAASQASDIKFRDLQSAHLASQLAMQAQQLQQSTTEHNDAHDEAVRKNVEWNQNQFGTQYDVLPNTHGNVVQYLRTASSNGAGQGGASVPAGVLMDSNSIYVPKQGENTFTNDYKKLSAIAPAIGIQAPSQDDYNSLKPTEKKSAVNQVNAIVHGLNPTTGLPFTSSKDQGAANASLEAALTNYDKDPDHDTALSSMLHANLTASQAKENALLQHETTKAQADAKATEGGKLSAQTDPAYVQKEAMAKAAFSKAEAQAKSEGDSKPVYAVSTGLDGTQKTVLTTSAAAAQNGMTGIRPVKQTDIAKDQHDIGVLSDIQVKSDNLKAASSAMDSVSPTERTAAAKVLANSSGSTVGALVNSGALGSLSAPAKQYVIAVQSLRESSMGLQKVLTGSARSSETQLQALQNTLPGIEPNSAVVHAKLKAFDQNLGLLSQRLPENTGVTNAVHAPEVDVEAPDGHIYFFKDQASANAFKQKAGIK